MTREILGHLCFTITHSAFFLRPPEVLRPPATTMLHCLSTEWRLQPWPRLKQQLAVPHLHEVEAAAGLAVRTSTNAKAGKDVSRRRRRRRLHNRDLPLLPPTLPRQAVRWQPRLNRLPNLRHSSDPFPQTEACREPQTEVTLLPSRT